MLALAQIWPILVHDSFRDVNNDVVACIVILHSSAARNLEAPPRVLTSAGNGKPFNILNDKVHTGV
jgi:hypothetical protein